ncbi:actophorin-like [Lingula anatina]|nr:actophorin-like [Lingula anatina]|eukprot:XP_013409787.1 actophorin-like [Lingula anatina]
MNKKYVYVIFKIVDHDGKANSAISVEETAAGIKENDQELQDKAYEEFSEKLRKVAEKKECRYAIFDYGFMQANATWKNTIIFFQWNPDNAAVKQKMLYTSSGKDFTPKLKGLGKKIQANSLEDIAESEIRAQCLDSSRAT